MWVEVADVSKGLFPSIKGVVDCMIIIFVWHVPTLAFSDIASQVVGVM